MINMAFNNGLTTGWLLYMQCMEIIRLYSVQYFDIWSVQLRQVKVLMFYNLILNLISVDFTYVYKESADLHFHFRSRYFIFIRLYFENFTILRVHYDFLEWQLQARLKM